MMCDMCFHRLTVQCTYMLHGAAMLRTQVQKGIPGQPLTLKDEGMLHIKMRFAKGILESKSPVGEPESIRNGDVCCPYMYYYYNFFF